MKMNNLNQYKVLILESKNAKTTSGFQGSLKILEEAHLVAQPYGWPHLVVHYEMFRLSLEFKQWNEVLGQIPRMFLALPGSWLGKAPKGNLGSTKMGIFEKAKDDKRSKLH